MLDSDAGRVRLDHSIHTYSFDTLSQQLLGLAVATFTVAFIAAFYLTWRKAKKQNLPLWDHTSRRLFWNMIIPMFQVAEF